MNDRLSYEELEKRLKALEHEHLLTREASRESEERYRALFDRSFDMVYIYDFEGRFVDASDVALDLIGYTREEFLNLTISSVICPEHMPLAIKSIEELKAAGIKKEPTEYRFQRKNRDFIWVEMSSSVIYRGSEPYAIQGIARDITERKRAEKNLRLSEEKYRGILDSMEEGYFEEDLKGNFAFFNEAACRMMGYDRDEMLGMNYHRYTSSETAQRMFEVFHRIYKTGIPERMMDYEVICKDGSVRVHELSAALLRDSSGQPMGFRGLARDVTERIKAEEALKKSEEQYRNILESMEEAYYEVDLKGNFTFFNSSVVSNLGYNNDEMMGMNFQQYVDKENAQKVFDSYHKVFLTGEPIKGFDWEIINKKGEKISVEASVTLKRDAQGKPIGFRGVVRDITKRKQAEEFLRESEEKYRTILESIEETYSEIDLEGNFTFFNESLCRTFGYTREELVGMNNRVYTTPEMAKRAFQMFNEIYRTGRTIIMVDYEIIRKDGTKRFIELSASMMRDPSGNATGFRCVGRDVTEWKKAEETLRESEERFRYLAELLPETVFETDLAGNFTFVNQSVHEQFGYEAEDLTGRLSIMDMIVPEDRDFGRRNMQRVLSGEKVGLKEYTARKKNDSTFPVMVHSTPIIKDGRPTGLRGFLIDISEKKNLEEQLMRAQKMEAIGTLAGGIAHDFNNLLMGILGNVSLMMMKVDETHQFHDRMKSIEEYVHRGSDLTKQLLGFARGGKYEVKPTDLGEFIQRSSEMFGRTKKEIRIHRKAQEDLWTVEVDHGQMEQVLLNLYVNAWQAMPGGGDLYISAENVELDMTEVSLYELKPGRYVKISVTDTGTGMDEATMARIFEPFFTTKERGRGTGLGLASVYGIIKNHGGFIKVESEKGVGSTFTINLPASGKAAEGEKKTGEQVSRGRETILLIDDEDMILDVGAQMLSSLGYSVLAAQGGSAGVDVYRENREDIDLVILDVIMPDLGGDVTFERLRNIDQTVNVLLSSGYSLDGQAKEIMEKGCKGFIQKPFSMEDLSKKIRGILDQQ